MVLRYPDTCLRTRALPAMPGSPETGAAAERLREAFSAVEGLGLAAPQVGISARVVLVELGDERLVLLNPEVVSRSTDLVTDNEGCLSVPGVYADVPRPQQVQVRCLKEDGQNVLLSLEGTDARLMLHEIDHLDGVLFFDHLPAADRRRVIREYRAAKEGAPSPA